MSSSYQTVHHTDLANASTDESKSSKTGKKKKPTDENASKPGEYQQTSSHSSQIFTTKSPSPSSIEPNINLSKEELLKLLSVFEGELQARDEVIAILKSECTQNPDMRYGLTSQPLKALQRDAATLEITSQDHVYEQTKEQLKKIIQHQKQSYKKLKQMHLASEEKYQRLSTEAEEEKRKHQEFIIKSDEFVSLLENDRERMKQILDQEKASHSRKERELARKLKENKEEVVRLKALSLELVENRQQQLQSVSEQKQLVASLKRQVEELQTKLKDADAVTTTEKEHSLQIENELEEQTNLFYKEHEILSAELADEKAKTKDLEEKIKSMGRQMQKLKSVDKNLRKTDDQLWRIKEKLEQEEKYDDLLEEVELLRETVAAMQEAEKIYTEAQEECKELRNSLEKELIYLKTLREEVEKLRKSTRNKTEMERCIEEAMFRFGEMERTYDAEYKKQDAMKIQLEEFRGQLQKIDESETLLNLNEIKIKQLQTTLHEIKEEKEATEAKLQIEKDRSAQYKEMVEDERSKITGITQKTIEESKKLLKAKEQLAALESKHIEETEKLHKKLEAAEERITQMITKEKSDQLQTLITNLRKQIAMLKKRLDQLESETETKENEARLAKEEAERAKKNLSLSTEQLKRLVKLGLSEQITAAKSEELKQKNTSLEISAASLQTEIKELEIQLRKGVHLANNNNNNVCQKGVAVSHISTQTDDGGKMTSCATRRLSRSNSTSGIETKPPAAKRVSSTSRRNPSFERARAPFKVGAVSTKKVYAPCENKSNSDRNNATSLPPLNGAPSSTLLNNVGKCLKTTREETNKSDVKKISRLTSSKSGDTTNSNKSLSTSSENSDSKETMSSKVTKSAVNQNHLRSNNKVRQSTSVERRGAISPTLIPKFRSSTPTSSDKQESSSRSSVGRISR